MFELHFIIFHLLQLVLSFLREWEALVEKYWREFYSRMTTVLMMIPMATKEIISMARVMMMAMVMSVMVHMALGLMISMARAGDESVDL
jgi:hypothetical protein